MSNTNNIAFFIQARLTSSRLPNKVLLPFDGEITILEIIISKLKKQFSEIPLYVCTSEEHGNEMIEEFCLHNNIQCFRGSEHNVLQRFINAAEQYNVDIIIRICADNPFLDVYYIEDLISFYKENKENEYWSYKTIDNIPVIKTHFGFFAEIVKTDALRKVAQATSENLYLEHVTNYIYTNSDFKFKLKILPDNLKDRDDLRFTIDDADDVKNLREVYQYYKSVNYNIEKTILYVDRNPLILNRMQSNIKKYSK